MEDTMSQKQDQQQRQWFRWAPPPRRGSRPVIHQGSAIPGYIWVPAAATVGLVTYGYFAFLEEVPLTKRQRWIATSPEFEQRLGDEEYKKLRQQYRKSILPVQHRASQTVRRVGNRIADASHQFCNKHHLPLQDVKRPYTYTVVRSDTANAFVLPGNHVFVLTGLFQFVRDEDKLAAVLGHEVAHNLARHAGERISGGFVVSVLSRLLLFVDPSGVLSSLLFPAASFLHSLPHSRIAESEADRIGLELAAMACFDPNAAKRVFSAMKEGKSIHGTREPPEFMSTHPSHERRIVQFDDWMPDALETYNKDDFGASCGKIRQDMASARSLAAISANRREEAQRRGKRMS